MPSKTRFDASLRQAPTGRTVGQVRAAATPAGPAVQRRRPADGTAATPSARLAAAVATMLRVGPGAAVVQRVLVPDTLNVAGEFHSESEGRRAEERQFSRARTGVDGYWQEGEFTVQSTFRGQTAGGERGDSPDLRKASTLTRFDERADLIRSQSELWLLLRQAGRAGDAETTAAIDTISRQLDEMFDSVTRAEAAAMPEIDTAWAQAMTAITRARSALATVRGKQATNPGAVALFMTSMRDTLAPMIALLNSRVHQVLQLPQPASYAAQFDALAFQRSRGMALAAGLAAAGGQRGTWKVGDQHIRDIRLLQSQAPMQLGHANVLSQAEFGGDLAAWRAEEQRRRDDEAELMARLARVRMYADDASKAQARALEGDWAGATGDEPARAQVLARVRPFVEQFGFLAAETVAGLAANVDAAKGRRRKYQ